MKGLIGILILFSVSSNASDTEQTKNFEGTYTYRWEWNTDYDSGLCRLKSTGITKYCSRITRDEVLAEATDELVIGNAKSQALYKCAVSGLSNCQVAAVLDNVFLNRNPTTENGDTIINVRETGREVRVLVTGN